MWVSLSDAKEGVGSVPDESQPDSVYTPQRAFDRLRQIALHLLGLGAALLALLAYFSSSLRASSLTR